jgi:hypothetical protein
MCDLRRHLPITASLPRISQNPVNRGDANSQTPGDLGALQSFGIEPNNIGCLRSNSFGWKKAQPPLIATVPMAREDR